ncbi:hypothetical protein Tco_0634055 [Tanacetum coccineum]
MENKDTTRKKVPNKVLRYFPVTPRLKRMYGSLYTTKHMTWHATGKCNEDGKMGHPIDGKAWKEFDNNNADLTKEPRNSYFMLTLLIPGPKSPGKDIDVYLKPLVEELKNLWKKPGSGQGYFAYPTCNDETPATRVNGKTAYVGHRRFLPMKHRWRKLKTFNGENKNKPTLPKLDSAQILRQLSRSPSCILGTLLMNNKSKDTNKARQDLKELLIRNELWLAKKGNGKFLKPHPNRDQRLTTQCNCVSTPSDKDGTMYYGVLEEILELDYLTLELGHQWKLNILQRVLSLTMTDDDELDVPHDFSSDSDSDSKDPDNQRVVTYCSSDDSD